eukprot:34504-Rhodomonas_salina.1
MRYPVLAERVLLGGVRCCHAAARCAVPTSRSLHTSSPILALTRTGVQCAVLVAVLVCNARDSVRYWSAMRGTETRAAGSILNEEEAWKPGITIKQILLGLSTLDPRLKIPRPSTLDSRTLDPRP